MSPQVSGRFRLSSILRPELTALPSPIPSLLSVPIRLDSNETPALLSSEASVALDRAITSTPWNRYPDPHATELRAALSASTAVSPDEIFIGAGSEEIISLLLRTCDQPPHSDDTASIVVLVPSFVMYRHHAKTRGLKVIEVPLDSEWDLDVTAICSAIRAGRPNLIFLGMPNNPTGGLFSEARVKAVIEAEIGRAHV